MKLVLGVAALVSIALTACSDDSNDGETAVIDVGTTAVGTCLDFGDEVGAEVTELPVIDCSEPHSHEIFAVVLAQDDVYPGFEALETEAQALCLGEFEDYVGVNAFDSTLFYSWLVPTLTTWDKEDDREIICVIGNLDGAPLVGSVQDSEA